MTFNCQSFNCVIDIGLLLFGLFIFGVLFVVDFFVIIIGFLLDDLDADFDGIKKINVIDWLLEK